MSSAKKSAKNIKPEHKDQCIYCLKPVLKNNMARHIYQKHPEHDQKVKVKKPIDCSVCAKKYPNWFINQHMATHSGTVIPVPSSSSTAPSYSTEQLLSMQSNPDEDTLLFDDLEQENKKEENEDFEEYLKRSRSPTPILKGSIGEDRSFKGNKSINFVECPYCNQIFIESEIFDHIARCPEAPINQTSKGGKKKTKRRSRKLKSRRSKKGRSRRNNKK